MSGISSPAQSTSGLRRAMGLSSLVVYGDRKSTRLNSSHSQTSYAVFCLKKKNPEASSHCAEAAVLRLPWRQSIALLHLVERNATGQQEAVVRNVFVLL